MIKRKELKIFPVIWFLLFVMLLSGLSFSVHAVTHVVNTTADSTDGTCDADCSLRDAITVANSGTASSTINFNIPTGDSGCNASDECTINVTGSVLPAITRDGISINGYSQSGASYGTTHFPSAMDAVLKIIVSGSNLSGGTEDGIVITADNVTIRGLSIIGFPDYGIFASPGGYTGLTIQGNFLGLYPDGDTVSANGDDNIYTYHSSTLIGTNGDGSNDAGERNLISGSGSYGLFLDGQSTVAGNFIGTDATGLLDRGNGSSGIQVDIDNCIVGTNGDGSGDSYEGNLISGNNNDGVTVANNIHGVKIAGNYIGTTATGLVGLGNNTEGVQVGNSLNTYLGSNYDGVSHDYERNIIADNGAANIRITSDNTLYISNNYIGLGVDGSTQIGGGYRGVFLDQATNIYVGSNGDGTNDENEGNYVVAHTNEGIYVHRSGGNHHIFSNKVGVTATSTSIDAGNGASGIHVQSTGSNLVLNVTIGGSNASLENTVAFNGNVGGEYGIEVADSDTDQIYILQNKMYNNHDIGIYIGSGANNDQVAPTISSERCSGSYLNLLGTSGLAGDVVRVFSVDSDEQEGQNFLGQGIADTVGVWRVTIPNVSGTIVATSTSTSNGSSRFTAPASFVVGGCSGRRRLIKIHTKGTPY